MLMLLLVLVIEDYNTHKQSPTNPPVPSVGLFTPRIFNVGIQGRLWFRR